MLQVSSNLPLIPATPLIGVKRPKVGAGTPGNLFISIFKEKVQRAAMNMIKYQQVPQPGPHQLNTDI